MMKVYFYEFNAPTVYGRFAAAMKYLRENPGCCLEIEPGIYELSTELSRRIMNEVIEGKHGENPQKYMFAPGFRYDRGIDFDGLCDNVILADGVTLMVNGFMEPLSIRNCKNVTLRGLTIDHTRKPYSKGVITSVEITDAENKTGIMSVRFGDRYPLTENSIMPRSMIYDTARGTMEFGSYKLLERRMTAPQTFEFTVRGLKESFLGDEIYIWHAFHSRPAILLQDCENVFLDGVTIHSQPGMGIVGHRAENIRIRGLSVVPSSGEHMSTNTDATHFASCRGYLRMENCTFEGQGDDSVNVHTYYFSAEKKSGCVCRLTCIPLDGTHTQAPDYPFVGDTLELTKRGTLDVCDRYTVREVLGIDDNQVCEVMLDRELPDDIDKYVIADADACPDFTFENCRARCHIARSVLIKTKRARVENCRFENVIGTAVEVAAEERWGEGISSDDIVIRNNVILHCAETPKTRIRESGGIAVLTDASAHKGAQHKNIEISGNVIIAPECPCGIYVSNAEKVVISGNTVVSAKQPIITEDCESVIIK